MEILRASASNQESLMAASIITLRMKMTCTVFMLDFRQQVDQE